MRNQFIVLLAFASAVLAQNEPFRPAFHFTPEKNWMNDPNGMVFYEGEWHLFYQYNPHGNTWGHMSWGHAVSRDLVRWEHLPLALAEENDVMIFSGSAVVDWKNTSGFGKDGQPPLVAIYTGHYTKKPLQNQHIADGRVALRLLLDTSSLEVFAQNGETVLTELIFPTAGPRRLSLTNSGETMRVDGITIHAIR